MATRDDQSACIAHETHPSGHWGKWPLRWATECSKRKTIQDIDSLYGLDDSVILHQRWVGEWKAPLSPASNRRSWRADSLSNPLAHVLSSNHQHAFPRPKMSGPPSKKAAPVEPNNGWRSEEDGRYL